MRWGNSQTNTVQACAQLPKGDRDGSCSPQMQQDEKSREYHVTQLDLRAFLPPTPGKVRLDCLPPCINNVMHTAYFSAACWITLKKKFEEHLYQHLGVKLGPRQSKALLSGCSQLCVHSCDSYHPL